MVRKGPDYPRLTIPHIRVVAGGNFGTGEIWTCSLKCASFATESAAQVFFSTLTGADVAQELNDLNTYLTGSTGGDGLASYADQFAVPAWKGLMPMLDQRATLTYVKVNAFGADDLQVNTITLDRQFAPVNGGVSSSIQLTGSTVVDWRTSHKSRGTGTHGSMHLPIGAFTDASGEAAGFGNGGTVSLATMRTAITNFLTKLNGPSSTGRQMLPAIIYTQLVGAPYKNTHVDRTPTANAIDSFLLSSLPGLTRRRGNKLKQAGNLTPINYGAVS